MNLQVVSKSLGPLFFAKLVEYLPQETTIVSCWQLGQEPVEFDYSETIEGKEYYNNGTLFVSIPS